MQGYGKRRRTREAVAVLVILGLVLAVAAFLHGQIQNSNERSELLKAGDVFSESYASYVHRGLSPADALGSAASDLNNGVRVSAAELAARTNLALNPSFETGLQGWAADDSEGTTTERDGARAYAGASSMRLSATGQGRPGVSVSSEGWPGIIAGNAYTLSAYVWSPTGSRVRLEHQWFATGSASLGRSSDTVDVAAGAWTRIETTATAPPNAVRDLVDIGVQTADGQSGDALWVDAVQLEAAPAASPYADGKVSVAVGPYELSIDSADEPAQAALSDAHGCVEYIVEDSSLSMLPYLEGRASAGGNCYH